MVTNAKWKTIGTIGLFLYGLYYVGSLDQWHFIDNVDLIIHEAGHVVFSFFGEFITIAGGTLMQLIIPSLFVGYFFFKRQSFSASILLYWVAINLFNISVYAGDALKMQLPLLTSDTDGHDWNQMLFQSGLLHHTSLISHLVFWLGALVLGFSLAWSLYSIYKPEYDFTDSSLNKFPDNI